MPTPGHRSDQKCVVPTFSDAEFELYHEWLGGSDERYKLWLRMYHPDSVDIGDQEGVSVGDSIFQFQFFNFHEKKQKKEAAEQKKREWQKQREEKQALGKHVWQSRVEIEYYFVGYFNCTTAFEAQ